MSVLTVVFFVAIIAYGSQAIEFPTDFKLPGPPVDNSRLECYQCEDETDEWGMNACRDPSRFDIQYCKGSENVCRDWVHKGLDRMVKGCWNSEEETEESFQIVWEMCNTTRCNKKTLTDYNPKYDPER